LLVWRLGNAKEILSTIRLALALSYSGQSKRQSMVEKRRAKGRKKKKGKLISRLGAGRNEGEATCFVFVKLRKKGKPHSSISEIIS
jgi:hypothetical protein